MKALVTYSLDIMPEKHILLMTYPLNPPLLYCKHLVYLYLTTIQSPTNPPANSPANLPQIPSKQYYSLPSPFGEGSGVRLVGSGVRLFFLLFLAHSIYSSYLCRRETISNDISSERSTAKNYRILCIFLHFIFGQSK